MHARILRVGARSFAVFLFVLSAMPGLAIGAPEADPAAQAVPGFQVQYPPPSKPPLDQIPANGTGLNFELVGHNSLLDNDLIPGLSPMGIPRGGNGNLGVASGPCVYVGSMTGEIPALVVDVSDPANPTVVGPVPGHVPGIGQGIDDVDTVADLNLMAIHMRPAVVGPFDNENATSDQIYDISDCRNPKLVTNFPVGQEAGNNSSLHMSTIWRDPNNPSRVLHVITFLGLDASYCPFCRPDNIDVRVVDLTGCPANCNPKVVAAWGMEAEKGIPKVLNITYPDGTTYVRPTVGHQASFSVSGDRLWITQLGFGLVALDSSLLAQNQPCEPTSPTVGEGEAARASHCLKLLNPNVVEQVLPDGTKLPGRLDWNPPFFAGHVHTVANVPGKPYVVTADEPNAPNDPTDCPWSWMRILYVGTQEQGRGALMNDPVPYRGDLTPGILGTMASMQNIPDRCPKPGTPAGPTTYSRDIIRDDHGPHEPLVFPDLVLATYYSDGLAAFAIDNPLTPIQVGAFYNKPVDTIRFCWTNCSPAQKADDGKTTIQQPPDPSFGPVDMRAFSRLIAKDGLLYYVDANSGLYIVRYTGPHADEIPGQGICVTGQIQQAGFEPCPPYGR